MTWRTAFFILAACGVSYIFGSVVPTLQAATTRTSSDESNRHTRACEMAAGSGWTAIDCSAGAAYSAVLTPNTRYVIQAIGGNPYIAMATAGSGQDADSNDGYLPQGSWLELRTPDSARYLTCDGSGDSSTLVYVECQ